MSEVGRVVTGTELHRPEKPKVEGTPSSPVELPKSDPKPSDKQTVRERMKAWWENPKSRKGIGIVSLIGGVGLGVMLVVAMSLRAAGINEVAGIKLSNMLMAKLAAYAIVGVLIAEQFRDSAKLQAQINAGFEIPFDKEATHKRALRMLALVGLATTTAILGITIGQHYMSGYTHFDATNLLDLLIPVVALATMTAASQKQTRLQIQQQQAKKELAEKELDKKDTKAPEVPKVTKMETAKQAADTVMAVVGVGALLATVAGFAARYIWGVEGVTIGGSTVPLDLNTFGMFAITGGALTITGIVGLATGRDGKMAADELSRREGLPEPKDKDLVRQMTAERRRRIMRQTIGGLLIAAGLFGAVLRVWSFFPKSMKGALPFDMSTDVVTVVTTSLTAISFVGFGVGLFSDASVSHERVKTYAMQQQALRDEKALLDKRQVSQ